MTHTRNTPASATTTGAHSRGHPATRPRTRLPVEDAHGRARRAREQAMAVRPLRDGRYVVDTDGGTYVADLEHRSCTCPDHQIRGARCKHLRRVAIEVTEGRVPPPQQRTAVCAVCGDPTFVPLSATGSQLCERHAPTPGDLVRDRETGKLLIVTAVTTERADQRVVEEREQSIAAFESNADYGDHEPVIDAVYVPAQLPVDGPLDLGDRKRYGFPASRLVPVDRGYADVDDRERTTHHSSDHSRDGSGAVIEKLSRTKLI